MGGVVGSAGSGGCLIPLVTPSRSRSRHSRPAWSRDGTAFPGEVIDVHGEQNRSVYQEVPLNGSDVAPVSPLAEDRAGGHESCINCKHGHHSPHLQLRYSVSGAKPGRGFGPTVSRASTGQHRTRSGSQTGRPPAMDSKPTADNAAPDGGSSACGSGCTQRLVRSTEFAPLQHRQHAGPARSPFRPLLAATGRNGAPSIRRPGEPKRLCRGAKLFDRRIHRHRPPAWYGPPSRTRKQEVASESRGEPNAP